MAVSNDLCEEDRRDQKILRRHLKEAKENNVPAKIKSNRIEINGKWYTAKDLENTDAEVEETSHDSFSEGETNVEGDSEVDEDDKTDGGKQKLERLEKGVNKKRKIDTHSPEKPRTRRNKKKKY